MSARAHTVQLVGGPLDGEYRVVEGLPLELYFPLPPPMYWLNATELPPPEGLRVLVYRRGWVVTLYGVPVVPGATAPLTDQDLDPAEGNRYILTNTQKGSK